MPEEYIDKTHAKRCNTVFWLVYIIDHEFGALIGGPTSIRDEDITAKLPSELQSSSRASALTIQIRLARLTATILAGNTLYYFLHFHIDALANVGECWGD